MTRELSRSSLAAATEVMVAALAIAGDDVAYGELVRRRQSQIRGLLRRLCRQASLADDLAQQTFFQAWRRLRTLRAPAAFGAWLRQIAVNAWLQHVRTHSGGAVGSGVQPMVGAAQSESGMSSDFVHAPPAYDLPRAAAHEPMIGERLDLERALSQLPPEVRVCIVLAYDQKMSHREIAAATRLPLGTVKSHIARGAARLRDLLRAYG